MKIVFTLACSAVMICNFVQGQNTTLAKIDQMKSTTKKNTALEIEKPVVYIEEVSGEKTESTFRLPDYSGKHSILNNKVGPNGEELFIKKNKHYYVKGTGKKIKAKSIDLREKPKSR